MPWMASQLWCCCCPSYIQQSRDVDRHIWCLQPSVFNVVSALRISCPFPGVKSRPIKVLFLVLAAQQPIHPPSLKPLGYTFPCVLRRPSSNRGLRTFILAKATCEPWASKSMVGGVIQNVHLKASVATFLSSFHLSQTLPSANFPENVWLLSSVRGFQSRCGLCSIHSLH